MRTLAVFLPLIGLSHCGSVKMFPYAPVKVPPRHSTLTSTSTGGAQRIPIPLDGGSVSVPLTPPVSASDAIPLPHTVTWLSFYGTGNLTDADLTRTFTIRDPGLFPVSDKVTTSILETSVENKIAALSTSPAVTNDNPKDICEWFSYLARHADNGVVSWNTPMYWSAVSANGKGSGKGAFLGAYVAEVEPTFMLNTFAVGQVKDAPIEMSESFYAYSIGSSVTLDFPMANVSSLTHGTYDFPGGGHPQNSWSHTFPDVHLITLPGTGDKGTGVHYTVTVLVTAWGKIGTEAMQYLADNVDFDLWIASADGCVPSTYTPPLGKAGFAQTLNANQIQYSAVVLNGPDRRTGLLTTRTMDAGAGELRVSVRIERYTPPTPTPSPDPNGGGSDKGSSGSGSGGDGKNGSGDGKNNGEGSDKMYTVAMFAIAAAVIFGVIAVVAIGMLVATRRNSAARANYANINNPDGYKPV